MIRRERAARPEDVDEICAALPETEFGTTWGGVPTWKVPEGEKGRGFLLFREPHPSVSDPGTGELWDDVLVISVPDAEAKAALVQDPATPYFTAEHFRRSTTVLLRLSRVGELTLDELTEIITEAWASRAPRRLVKEHLPHG